MRVRAELGELFADAEFAAAFAVEGKPGWSPGRLTLIKVLQRVENLTDRQSLRLPVLETKRAELRALAALVVMRWWKRCMRRSPRSGVCGDLPALQALRVMLIPNYVRVTDRKGGGAPAAALPRRRWRGTAAGQSKADLRYDVDAVGGQRRRIVLERYKLHIGESCHTPTDPNGKTIMPPNLITSVATTDATVLTAIRSRTSR